MIALAGLAVASPALAHVDPEPADVQADGDLSVGFAVQHRCKASATEQLDVLGPIAELSPGWTDRVDDNVVTFEGGPLPDEQARTFHLRVTLPATPGTTIYFPFVRRCELGEIRWIDVPSAGSGELDGPAPAMQIVGPIATVQPAQTTRTTAVTTPKANPPSSLTTTTESPTSVLASVSTSGNPPAINDGGSQGRGSSGSLVFAFTIGAVVLIGVIVALQSRRSLR